MAKTPKVSNEDYEKQTSKLYADLGRIAVHSEHLNNAMHLACMSVLTQKGLPSEYATTVLAGMNLENSRRLWVSLMKLAYRGNTDANEMLKHLSTRIDNVTRRRNDNIHRVWYIGWGNEETPSYEVADSVILRRDVSDKGQGGVKVSSRDTKDFVEIIDELIVLKEHRRVRRT
jgi:hypothetical protein